MLDPQKLREDLVPVLRTVDETAAAVAKSILDEAGILCAVKGGFMSDVTGISRLGTLCAAVGRGRGIVAAPRAERRV